MSKLPNVALCGYMGSGKTSVAEILVRDHGYQRLSFAQALKDAFEVLADRPISKQTDRIHLQALGAWGRAVNPLFWVSKLTAVLESRPEDAPPVVIDDLRFPNEAWTLRTFYGFKVVKLDTPLNDCKGRIYHRDGDVSAAWFEDDSETAHLSIQPDITVAVAMRPDDVADAILKAVSYVA